MPSKGNKSQREPFQSIQQPFFNQLSMISISRDVTISPQHLYACLVKKQMDELEEYRKNNLNLKPVIVQVQKDFEKFLKSLTKTQTLEEAKQYLNAYDPPSGKCGKILKFNSMWICYTCINKQNPLKDEIIPVFCTDCIKGGDHESHQIKMIRSGGGFCDCGNDQILLKSGFCKKHGGLSYDSLNLNDFMCDIKQQLFLNIERVVSRIDVICIQFDSPDFEKVRLEQNTLNLYKDLLFRVKFLNTLIELNGYCGAKIIEQLKKVSKTQEKALHHYKKPPANSEEDPKSYQCQKHIYDNYYSLLDEEKQEESKEVVNFEELEKQKRCRCIRLNNIMRSYKNLQHEAQVQINKLLKTLVQSSKFAKLFRLCYFANIKEALLTPKFYDKQKDLFQNIAISILPSNTQVKKFILQQENFNNFANVLHRAIIKSVIKMQKNIDLAKVFNAWAFHFSLLGKNIGNLAILHNFTLIFQLVLQKMQILDFHFQVARPKDAPPPWVIGYRVEFQLLSSLEKIEKSILPLILSYSLKKMGPGPHQLAKLTPGILSSGINTLNLIDQKNLFTYCYQSPKLLALIYLKLGLLYFEGGLSKKYDEFKRNQMQKKKQQPQHKEQQEEEVKKSQELKIYQDVNNVQILEANQKKLHEDVKQIVDCLPEQEKNKSGALIQNQLKQEMDGQNKEPIDSIMFFRRMFTAVLKVKSKEQFAELSTKFLQLGIKLVTIIINIQIGIWNKLGREVMGYPDYYYAEKIIPRYVPDYALYQIGMILAGKFVPKRILIGRLQNLSNKIIQVIAIQDDPDHRNSLCNLIKKELKLNLHFFVNVMINPTMFGMIAVHSFKGFQNYFQQDKEHEVENMYEDISHKMMKCWIFNVLSRIQNPKRGEEYDKIKKEIPLYLRNLDFFDQQFKRLTVMIQSPNPGESQRFRLKLQDPEIKNDWELSVDPYFNVRMKDKLQFWENYPHMPLGRLIKGNNIQDGIRSFPFVDKIRSQALQFDADFLTTFLVLTDYQEVLEQQHRVDILKLFSIGLQYRNNDPDSAPFSEFELQLIADLLKNIRTSQCDGDKNKILKCAINQLLRFLNMQDDLDQIEQEQKKMLVFEEGVKSKKQKRIDRIKNKAMNNIKQMQNKFKEKMFGIVAPPQPKIEEEKKKKQEEQQNKVEQCCLCHQDLQNQHRSHPYGRAAFIGSHRLLYHSYKNAIKNIRMKQSFLNFDDDFQNLPQQLKNPDECLPLPKKFMKGGLFINSCGHYLHYKCLNQMRTDAQQERKYIQRLGRQKREYLCPLCKTISNALVPDLNIKNCQNIVQGELRQSLIFKHGNYGDQNIVALMCFDFLAAIIQQNRILSHDFTKSLKTPGEYTFTELTTNPIILYQAILNYISYEIQSIKLKGVKGFWSFLRNQQKRSGGISQMKHALIEVGKKYNISWDKMAKPFLGSFSRLIKTQLVSGEIDLLQILVAHCLISNTNYDEDIKRIIAQLFDYHATLSIEAMYHKSLPQLREKTDFAKKYYHSRQSTYFILEILTIITLIYKPDKISQCLKIFKQFKNFDEFVDNNLNEFDQDFNKHQEEIAIKMVSIFQLAWDHILELESQPLSMITFISKNVCSKIFLMNPQSMIKYPWIENLNAVPKFEIFSVPDSFSQLQIYAFSEPCQNCKTTPQNYAVCLYCGKRVCIFNPCCEKRIPQRVGEGTQHMLQCGAGMGAYAVAHQSQILMVDRGRTFAYQGYYQSKMGEKQNVISNVQLLKNRRKFEEIRTKMLNYDIPSDVTRSRVNEDQFFRLFVA